MLWIIDSYGRGGIGGAHQTLRWLRTPARVVHAPTEPLPSPASVGAVVLTGSKASAVGDLPPWIAGLTRWTRAVVDRGVPLLGVCFGHQLLARAVGGRDAVRTRKVPEVGWVPVEHGGDDPLLTGLPSPLTAYVTHRDEVVDAPPGLTVLARSATSVQAVRVPGAPQWGVQFHPEFTREEELRLVAGRRERHPGLVVPPPPPEDASAQARHVFDRFVSLVRQLDA